jgi:predicted deacylase
LPVDLAHADVTWPDLGRHAGRGPLSHVVSLDAARSGPHVVITALTHGNEMCGAVALCRLIDAGLRPEHGRLSLVFVNVAAYETFDPARPFAARYLDEDLNRLWSDAVLDQPARSREHARAQALRPLIAQADTLLDLHSTSLASPPMLLCGRTAKARRLARTLGFPGHVIADGGHAAGPRLIDYGAFAREDATPVAVLVECGQHLAPSSADIAEETVLRFLLAVGTVSRLPAGARPLPPPTRQRLLEVSHAVTIASPGFAFVRAFESLERIPRAGTVIAYDGGGPIATPYDDAILVMPTLAPVPGETAVRLAREVPFPETGRRAAD